MDTDKPSIEPAFSVNAPSSQYSVYADNGLLNELGSVLKTQGIDGTVYIISDSKVWSSHGEQVVTSLNRNELESRVFTVEAGEATKNLSTTNQLYEWLASERCERKSTLLALGGGMIGDLTGFVAATFLRGIPFIQIPTSLSAMVDASIGGKTAVNLSSGKNLVGAFYQPKLVLADLNTLKTLPARELASGWAEAIKHGLILDSNLFYMFEKNNNELINLEPDLTRSVVQRSMEIKGKIVEQDEKETTGLRMLLNYGHTIGHALESVTNYSSFLHGEAVSVGMVAAGKISVSMGLLSNKDLDRYTNVLTNYGLPTSCPGIDPDSVLDAIQMDKKVKDKKINWILLTEIGNSFVSSTVDDRVVQDTIKDICI
ncbi:MAG: 3-dehydroquinate synthase [Dehalococcoidia bacterium]|nr:3-dehydroquinate synthase [Dehalococcoidia bacterium]